MGLEKKISSMNLIIFFSHFCTFSCETPDTFAASASKYLLNETIKEGKVSAWSNLLTNHVHNKTLISVDGSQVGVA